jgi:predicted acetyltransferase
MPLPSGYEMRSVSSDELGAFFDVLIRSFGEDMSPEALPIEKLTAEPDRTIAVFDENQIIGTAGAFTFDMSVPGGRLPTAGVTYVSVAATHRRKGILTQMMASQLADIHDRGEPLATLWASEAAIYGRFGYGLANHRLRVELDRVDARLRADLPEPSAVSLRSVEPEAAIGALMAVESQLVDARPGRFERDEGWIKALVADPESFRRGWSKLQCVLAEEGGEPVGYVLFRTKPGATVNDLPDGELRVTAQGAVTPAAELALMRLLLSVDLMRRVRWSSLPVDTALPHLLADPRMVRATWLDGLHARVVDVPSALAARRYAAPVDVALEVRDERCPWNAGRFQLTGDSDGADCRRTDVEPQLTLPAEALGAVYLGGTPLSSLAAAGRVQVHDEKALARVSTAFGWPAAPWCPVVF